MSVSPASPAAAAPELLALRGQIDALDRELLGLLNQRMALALEVGELKKRDGSAVFRAGALLEPERLLFSIEEPCGHCTQGKEQSARKNDPGCAHRFHVCLRTSDCPALGQEYGESFVLSVR